MICCRGIGSLRTLSSPNICASTNEFPRGSFLSSRKLRRLMSRDTYTAGAGSVSWPIRAPPI
jgi:hypothetical protein